MAAVATEFSARPRIVMESEMNDLIAFGGLMLAAVAMWSLAAVLLEIVRKSKKRRR
jgi:hypothetical protein